MSEARRPIAIASDHAGFALKEELKKALAEATVAFDDLGTYDETSTDYPSFGHALASAIEAGRYVEGILVCGTGVGMSITANRHKGVRAVVCSEPFSARMAREHNDANVLCLGARVIGVGTARDILRVWLDATFEGGRHARRVAMIEPSG